MASSGNLLDYGIAVNFFGNYQNEGNAINNLTNKLNSSLMSLQQMVIGGGITAGLYKLSNAILSTAQSMEQNFANLKSTLGSTAKALETLDWARQKGASTPFEISEVNDAVGTMTTMGFNKNDKMREEVFNSVGDFAALRGFNFADMMQRVSKASFGNWESLGDQFGIRKQTIGTMARERMARTPEKFKGEEADIAKAIQMVEKGKQGTEEYKMAIVKLMGVLGRGGMENRLQTIAGAWSNVNDLMQNFMMKMVGYSQIQGTLANTIKETIVNRVLKPFTDAHTVVINGVKEQVTAVDQLGNIGKGVGDILTQLWGGIDSAIGNASATMVGWIDKMDAFFSDYKNNVAPLILFLYLVRLQVMDFLSAFWGGFEPVFKGFIKLGLGVYKILGDIAMAMGLGGTKAEALGHTLGIIMGILLGIKAFKLITSPLQPLVSGARTAYMELLRVKGMISVGEGWTFAESVNFRWMQFGDMVGKLSAPLRIATASSWSFTASLLANPIGLVVIAVIALVAWIGYLIYNWDEVQKSMQGVSDITLVLLSIFMPIIGIPLLLAKYWDEFSEIFYNIWRGIRGYLLGAWLWINRTVIIPLKNAFVSVWTSVKNAVTGFVNMVFDKFPFIKKIFEGIATVWNGIKDTISWIWDKIVNSDFVKGILDIVTSVSDAFGDGGEKFLAEQNAKNAEIVDSIGDRQYAQYYQTKGDYVKEPVVVKTEPKVVNNYNGAINLPNVQNPSDFQKELANRAGRK
jgi:hypothetical protein